MLSSHLQSQANLDYVDNLPYRAIIEQLVKKFDFFRVNLNGKEATEANLNLLANTSNFFKQKKTVWGLALESLSTIYKLCKNMKCVSKHSMRVIFSESKKATSNDKGVGGMGEY